MFVSVSDSKATRGYPGERAATKRSAVKHERQLARKTIAQGLTQVLPPDVHDLVRQVLNDMGSNSLWDEVYPIFSSLEGLFGSIGCRILHNRKVGKKFGLRLFILANKEGQYGFATVRWGNSPETDPLLACNGNNIELAALRREVEAGIRWGAIKDILPLFFANLRERKFPRRFEREIEEFVRGSVSLLEAVERSKKETEERPRQTPAWMLRRS